MWHTNLKEEKEMTIDLATRIENIFIWINITIYTFYSIYISTLNVALSEDLVESQKNLKVKNKVNFILKI